MVLIKCHPCLYHLSAHFFLSFPDSMTLIQRASSVFSALPCSAALSNYFMLWFSHLWHQPQYLWVFADFVKQSSSFCLVDSCLLTSSLLISSELSFPPLFKILGDHGSNSILLQVSWKLFDCKNFSAQKNGWAGPIGTHKGRYFSFLPLFSNYFIFLQFCPLLNTQKSYKTPFNGTTIECNYFYYSKIFWLRKAKNPGQTEQSEMKLH